jgi:TRAP-type C4-dicarboxylate transport system permease large subunit
LIAAACLLVVAVCLLVVAACMLADPAILLIIAICLPVAAANIVGYKDQHCNYDTGHRKSCQWEWNPVS